MATDTQTARCLEDALGYGSRGLQVVPLHNLREGGGCSCKEALNCPQGSWGKHPRLGAWQKKASSKEDDILAWWDRWPLANVGILLGPKSGIIDIEFDTETGRQTADSLFVDCFTPTYKSGRSTHRLFRWSDNLPRTTKIERYGLEVRLGGANEGLQSVFPPSEHWTGVKYRWCEGLSLDEVDIAAVPDSVVALLFNDPDGEFFDVEGNGKARSKEHWDRILRGVEEGSRRTDMLSYIGKLLFSVRNLNDTDAVRVVYASVQAVNERNQPEPLPEKELQKAFTEILKAEQNKRTTAEAEGVMRDTPEDRLKEKEKKDTKGMQLVIVESDPLRFELYAKQFAKSEEGCIVLTADQMNSPRSIRIEALRQAEYPIPAAFDKSWTKKDGLYERLVFSAEHRAAPPEENRQLVVAERLKAQIAKPTILGDGEKPTRRKGRPCLLPDGSIVFQFTRIWEDMGLSADKVKRTELSRILTKIECGEYGKDRLKKLSRKSLSLLDRLLGHESERSGQKIPSSIKSSGQADLLIYDEVAK